MMKDINFKGLKKLQYSFPLKCTDLHSLKYNNSHKNHVFCNNN